MADLKSKLKKTAYDAIDAAAKDLHELSADIWSHPELGLEEKHAHDVLTSFLEKYGFQTTKSHHMDTAFEAAFTKGTDTPNIAFLSEFDALPVIGHACGHNLIAEVGVAAGLGLKAALQASHQLKGKVTVLGTPAEEGYGGKIDLINAGAFSNIDVAMMSHPFPASDVTPTALARDTTEITYTGKASHAAGYPWKGVNALDAAVMCYNGISCLRQQIKPDWRIHCIFKEGGIKVNIIPDRTVLHVAVRAPTSAEMYKLKEKVLNISAAAAQSTGCQVEHRQLDREFSSMLHNQPLVDLYMANLSCIQPETVPSTQGAALGSTDMGNVSHVVPSIHPAFYIGGVEVNHTPGFTRDAGDAKAQPYTLNQAKALAAVAIDILLEPGLLDIVKTKFQNDINN